MHHYLDHDPNVPPISTVNLASGPYACFLVDMPDWCDISQADYTMASEVLPLSLPGPAPRGISIHEAIMARSTLDRYCIYAYHARFIPVFVYTGIISDIILTMILGSLDPDIGIPDIEPDIKTDIGSLYMLISGYRVFNIRYRALMSRYRVRTDIWINIGHHRIRFRQTPNVVSRNIKNVPISGM